jgi:hypothetical protein
MSDINANRTKILDMLAQGKITVSEATSLLNTLDSAPAEPVLEGAVKNPKFLRVQVLTQNGEGHNETVNVRVPLQLLRSGIKLASLMPPRIQDEVNKALKEQGMGIDFNKLKPEDLDNLVTSLAEMTVDVDNQREKVKVFCE